MDEVLSTLIHIPVWGFVAVVIILIIVNPRFLSELTRLIDHLSRRKEPIDSIEYANYRLFKLERTRSGTSIAKYVKPLSTIYCAVLIAISSFLLYLILITPKAGISPGLLSAFFIFFFLFPIINLIDNYAHIRSSIELELDGEPETLLRFCLKMLFDARVTITKFDVAGQIEGILYGNEIKIKIEKSENSRNTFTLNSDGTLINTLVYSDKFRTSINNLVRSLCYQKR